MESKIEDLQYLDYDKIYGMLKDKNDGDDIKLTVYGIYCRGEDMIKYEIPNPLNLKRQEMAKERLFIGHYMGHFAKYISKKDFLNPANWHY